jgi:hypothetical protein
MPWPLVAVVPLCSCRETIDIIFPVRLPHTPIDIGMAERPNSDDSNSLV